MARHPVGSQAGRRAQTRNRIYTIVALLIIAVVVAYIYGLGPFGKNADETTERVPDTNVPEVNEVESPPITESIPKPAPEPNLPKIETGSTIEPSPEVTRLIAEATSFLGEKPSRIIEARDSLNNALRMPMSAQQRAFVKDQLSELANKWLFDRTIFPGDQLCESYQVKPGDQLRLIGERFKVPYEILMDINKIDRPEALQAGQPIKVINGPFHAKVFRSAFTMDLYLQNTFVRSFSVGLGKPGMETPTGLWRVRPGGKLEKPPWKNPVDGRTYYPEDPDYPLGSRWIGLEGLEGAAKDRIGFAIHGTKDPEQIGTADSQGCIRLDNGNAILVYNLLEPGFSTVEVVE